MSPRAPLLLALSLIGCSPAGGSARERVAPQQSAAPPAASALVTPRVDHHKHLVSRELASWASDIPLSAVPLPAVVASLLAEREHGWDDAAALAPLLSEDVVLLDDREFLTRGRQQVAEVLSQTFGRAHRITPVDVRQDGSTLRIAGYFTRDTEDGVRHFGHVLMQVVRERDTRWRIASEAQVFPGPYVQQPLDAAQLITELDGARLGRAVVMSVAYWYGGRSPRERTPGQEHQLVRRENDWVAAQAAAHPDRLVAFCSFNPLREYALEELERCAAHPHLRGLKLHFGNSRVDLENPEHVAQLQRVFERANALRLPVVVHLWTGPEYERAAREHAQIFLRDILSRTPDVPVQIAHFAGGGPGYTDAALEVYADAIASGASGTRNLYFELATVADRQPPEVLLTLARRIRQVGVERVLWGTDLSPPNPPAMQSWLNFMATVPLSDEEMRAIAGNVAPYLRE